MKTGKVKFFNQTKGFGFIIVADGHEIFVHKTGLIETIRQNDLVEFEEEQGQKGVNAVKVKKI